MAQTKSANERADEARRKAAEARLQAEADAEEARRKALADEEAAKDKAAADEQKSVAGGKHVVLVSAFVARTSKDDKRATRRYNRGEVFEPVSGLHDVDSLVAQGTLGKVGGKEPLRPMTALAMSQRAARLHQENSPVIDLRSQPFEVRPQDTDDE
jgi:hypothetical protein